MTLAAMIRRALVLAALVSLCAVPAARATWTTYRGDAQRSGIDASSVGRAPFASAWISPALDGVMFAQPLVYRGRVFAATESNQVYALDESTGAVVWQAAAGTPVAASSLGCGDIKPTVGITSTAVIDPATGRLFVVADTWDGAHTSSIQHRLYAFGLADGKPAPGFPVNVDPPGSTPRDQLQRPALALDNGEIVIAYGGNAGDCGTYNGWLAAVKEAGGAPAFFQVESGSTGGAIWGSGSGPTVDAAGHIWATSGNGFGSTYAHQESVLELDPGLGLVSSWAPSNWAALDQSDTDLGSSEPLLLPGGLVFQIGKAGVGYLLRSSGLGGLGAAPAYQASVCSGGYGGGIYSGGVIYVTCSDGLRALSLDTSAAKFSPLAGWQVTGSVNGPPIEAGGLVWAVNWRGRTLYGLDPRTGQAVVTQSTPAMEHFTTPSASDGKLFLATGDTIEAYTIASAAPPPPPPAPVVSSLSPSAGPAAGGAQVTITGTGFTNVRGVSFGSRAASRFTVVSPTSIVATAPAGSGTVEVKVVGAGGSSASGGGDRFRYVPVVRCTVRGPRRGAVRLHRAPHRGRLLAGTLAVTLRCSEASTAVLKVSVTRTRHGGHAVTLVRSVRVRLPTARARTVEVALPPSALRALVRGTRESAVLTLTAVSAGGRSTAVVRIPRLRS